MTQILAVRSAFPARRYRQEELTRAVADRAGLNGTRRALLERLHRNSGVDTRHTALPLEEYRNVALAARPDLAVVRGGHVTRLTHLNEELFTARKLGEVRPLAVSSSFDKRPIDAWLVLPPDFVSTSIVPEPLRPYCAP